MNLEHKYCVYRSTHPSGLYYSGKGITAKVLSGEYRGSGVRFTLATMMDRYSSNTWTTEIIDTFETEDAALAAEELLVPIEALMDPLCLNMQKGGKRGRGCGPGMLLRMIKSKKKRAAMEIKKAKAKEKKAATTAKYKELQRQLKEKGKK